MKRISLKNSVDKELLDGLAIHNKDALQTLYKHYFPMISRMVQQNNGDENDAKDLFQDGLMVLYEKSKDKTFVLECKLNTYIYAVCKRLWLKQLHQKQKQNIVDEVPEQLFGSDMETDVSVHEEKEKQFNLMSDALKKLGEPCKSLIEDFYLNQFSMQEITEKYGYTNTDNAKTQKYKCLKRLKKLFFEQNDNKRSK